MFDSERFNGFMKNELDDLRYMFEHLPLAESEADYRALLPQYADRNSILSMIL